MPIYGDSFGGLQQAIQTDRDTRDRNLYNALATADARARADRSEAFQRQQYADKLKAGSEADARYDTAYGDSRTDVANNLKLNQDRLAEERQYHIDQTGMRDGAAKAREDAATGKEILGQAHDLIAARNFDPKMFAGKIPDPILQGLTQTDAALRAQDVDEMEKSRNYATILNTYKVATGAVKKLTANQKLGDLNTNDYQHGFFRSSVVNPAVKSQEDRALHIALSAKLALEPHIAEIQKDKRAMQYVMPDENGNYVPTVKPPPWMVREGSGGAPAAPTSQNQNRALRLQQNIQSVPPPQVPGVSPTRQSFDGQVLIQMSNGRKGYATPEAAAAIMQRDPQAIILGVPNFMDQRAEMANPRAYSPAF